MLEVTYGSDCLTCHLRDSVIVINFEETEEEIKIITRCTICGNDFGFTFTKRVSNHPPHYDYKLYRQPYYA